MPNPNDSGFQGQQNKDNNNIQAKPGQKVPMDKKNVNAPGTPGQPADKKNLSGSDNIPERE